VTNQDRQQLLDAQLRQTARRIAALEARARANAKRAASPGKNATTTNPPPPQDK
jgi:hypothetical protein